MNLLEKIVVDKGEDDDLPPGWKKEVKARKGYVSKTKYDKFYTDPITGYIFHSLKDVQRYLKTGEVGRLASKPKDNDDVNRVNGDEKVCVSVKMEEREERSESIQQMNETWRNKRPPEEGPAGCKTRSKSSETGKSESSHRASKRLAGIDIGSPSLHESKTRQATQLAAIKTNALPPPPSPSLREPKTRQATRQSGIKFEDPAPSLPEPKTRQVTRQLAIKIEGAPPSPSMPEPKTRQATLQAGIQINSPPSSPPDIRSNRQATRQSAIKVYAPTPSLPEPKTRQAIQQAGIKINASMPLPEPYARQATRQSPIKIDAPPLSPSLPEPKTRQASRQAGIKIDSPPPSPPDSRKSRQAKRPAGIKINAIVPKTITRGLPSVTLINEMAKTKESLNTNPSVTSTPKMTSHTIATTFTTTTLVPTFTKLESLISISAGKVPKVHSDRLLPANPKILDGVEDLIQLSSLHEPSVLYNPTTKSIISDHARLSLSRFQKKLFKHWGTKPWKPPKCVFLPPDHDPPGTSQEPGYLSKSLEDTAHFQGRGIDTNQAQESHIHRNLCGILATRMIHLTLSLLSRAKIFGLGSLRSCTFGNNNDDDVAVSVNQLVSTFSSDSSLIAFGALCCDHLWNAKSDTDFQEFCLQVLFEYVSKDRPALLHVYLSLYTTVASDARECPEFTRLFPCDKQLCSSNLEDKVVVHPEGIDTNLILQADDIHADIQHVHAGDPMLTKPNVPGPKKRLVVTMQAQDEPII